MTEPPLAYNIIEAAAIARGSRTAIYEALRRGELRGLKRGSRTLILGTELKRWLESLPAYTPKSTPTP